MLAALSRAGVRLRPVGRARRSGTAPGDLRPRRRRRLPAAWRPDGVHAWVRRPRHLLMAAGGALVVIAAGATAYALAVEQADERPPAASRPAPASGGGLTLTPRPGWVRSSGPSALPGTKRSADVVLVEPVSKTRLVATLVPATSSTLLPDELLRELTQPPEDPVEVRLGGRLSAYYYRDLSLPGVRGRLDVYAAPTTEGVATVACLGPPSPLEECADTANTLQLGQGEPIRADPGTAFRLELFPVMDEVDAAREQTRRLLQRATTPKEQAAAAAAVSVAYGNAARRLEPLAASSFAEQRAVVAQLRTNATAYARLSGDLKAQDEAALVRDREIALKGETRLKALVSEQQG